MKAISVVTGTKPVRLVDRPEPSISVPDEIKVRVLHSGVGAITESDVTLASASGAPIIGFNVRPNAKAREVAERNKVEFRYYDVIYHLTDWVKGAMAGELGPEII